MNGMVWFLSLDAMGLFLFGAAIRAHDGASLMATIAIGIGVIVSMLTVLFWAR